MELSNSSPPTRGGVFLPKRYKIFGEHTYEWIVRRDKKLILSSDILVAYIDSYGITTGTTMETIFAFENGIPTYLIDTKQKHVDDYWFKFHTKKIFKTVDECFSEILNLKI